MEEVNKTEQKLPNQEIDYFKILKILTSRWYWIAGSIAVCLLAAHIYLWYTPKTFATGATMKFDEKRSEISELASVITSSEKGPSRIQGELFVIQSKNLVLRAIKNLDYRISFYVEGRVRTSEIYPNKPLTVNLIKFDSLSYYTDVITFKPVDKNTFNLSFKSGGQTIKKNYPYNSAVNISNTVFTISYPGEISANAVFLFKFNTPESFLGRALGGLRTSEVAKNSNIINLSVTDSNPEFASDILNSIMREYLAYDREHRTESATQMITFIDQQLDTLTGKVRGSENSIASFKQNSKMIDLSSLSQAALSKATDLESSRSLLKIQLEATEQLKQQIDREKNNVTVNFNYEGSIDPMLAGLLASLNNLMNERNALLGVYNSNSPQVTEINKRILQVKNTAYENISATRDRIQKSIANINAQLTQADQKIVSLPVAERSLVSLKRDFEINEKVYSFLSEKKLEAQISRSAILPGASIIEPAHPNFSPVSPNDADIKKKALLFGIALGLTAIVLIRILNPFIYDKETIESLTTVPIIGVIRKFPDKLDENSSQILALSKPRSIFAESVRSVRTNLNFLASEKQSKVICITSEVAGEGKSFVAVNLSSTISLIDKKVVVVAADLRRSKLHKTFQLPNDTGLSNYLAHQNTIDDIIIHTDQENLDFIPSGPVPPNPSELLHSERMANLLTELKGRYDIVMVDTAPVGLVSDSIPLIRISDINVFVIRSGKSKYYSATIPQRIAQEYHLDNSVIILNAFEEDILHSRYYTTKFTGGTYNNKYYYYSDYSGYESSGYYVDQDDKKWWDITRWFK